MARRVKRRVKKKVALLKPYSKKLLGGEAHAGYADPRSPVLRLLENLRTNRTFLLGFVFASGLAIGTGLALLLSRRRA